MESWRITVHRARRIALDLRDKGAGVLRDFAAWPVRGPRLADEIECVLSVLLAIGFAHFLQARNVGWAAFSGYMVIRAHVSESLRRGILRIVGTAAGAAVALLVASHIAMTPARLSVTLALIGGTTLYGALTDRRSYAWLFTGLTACMVLLDGTENPAESLHVFAQSRLIEVAAGTTASILVSAISTFTIRRRWPSGARSNSQPSASKLPIWHKAAARHALQGAIALSLIPWIWDWLGIKGLAQASITIMAVMLVPLASLSGSALSTSMKLRHRFIGCSVGALFATGILLVAGQLTLVMLIAVCVGVVVGRHIENGPLSIGYVGTQFALAFLVVLVPDTYTAIDPSVGLDRLTGVFCGMVLLEPVRIAFRQFL
jgi:uncharacterized membrane protein YccC